MHNCISLFVFPYSTFLKKSCARGDWGFPKTSAGVPLALWGQLQKGEAVGGFSPNDVLGPARRGLSLLYATDTRPVDRIALYGKDADLLILEGMFGEEEKKARALAEKVGIEIIDTVELKKF